MPIPAPSLDPELGDAWRAFRERRTAELREPYGWLTIQGFAWLPQQPESPEPIDGLPGRWGVAGDRGYVVASAADGLRRWDEAAGSGESIAGRDEATVAETGRIPWLGWGDVQIELLRRGGRLAVRWRSRTSPQRETFTGIPTFDHDPGWVVTAHLQPYGEPTTVDVATHRPELRQRLRAIGEVSFTLDGQPQRLVVTEIKSGWSIEFHDPTNGVSTPAWRQLKFDPPTSPASDGSGEVVLDFNRTIDMWFAVTPHATCPAPCQGNTITVPVTAGEKSPPRP